MMIEYLLEEKKKLSRIIRETKRRLDKAPEGCVRIVKHRNGYQFYLRTEGGDTSGVYLPVSERRKALALIQKRYDSQIRKAAEKQLDVIDYFLQKYDPESLKKIYQSMSEARKEFVVPVELPDEEYVKEWVSRGYTRKNILEGTPEHYTNNGERVRSKSEVMIAEALTQAGIPYKYECPLELGGIVIYPDFTILRQEDREILFWEHLGMMDDPDYCRNALNKIRMYETHNIFPGINLILTMETSGIPINLSVIKCIIKEYCK